MQALSAHSPQKGHRRGWIVAILVVVLVAVVAGGAYYLGHRTSASSTPPTTRPSHVAGVTVTPAAKPAFTLVSTVPAPGAQGVDSSSSITLQFSAPPAPGTPMPTLSPPVPGNWQVARSMLTFLPTAPLAPFSTETLTIPGGPGGMHSAAGAPLAATTTAAFTIAAGSTLRLQQLLADLGYLPVSFAPVTPQVAPNAMADEQTGTFSWRWPLPVQLQSLWIPGATNVITQGAVMSFERRHALTVDGIAGQQVWADLLKDAAAGVKDPEPYVYVFVSKVVPQNLTLFDNGAPQYTNVPVNTGAPGADTQDGTFAVFEHVPSSRMTGTNPDGSHYDDPAVPWASYFNGGDALHGFPRASYGTPQSNGCVEMAIPNAATLWPLTPVGTLVTVDGPPVV